MPSPPSSQDSDGENKPVEGPIALFEEWPLQNAVLKRAMGMARLRIELEWNLCADHGGRGATTRGPKALPMIRSSTRQGTVLERANYTPEEDELLRRLREEEEDWVLQKEIHRQFNGAFPQQCRNIGALQLW